MSFINANFILKNIGLEEYVNATLVYHEARPAYLLQYIDYDEKSPTDPVSARKLAVIKTIYPDLVYTKNAQGMIISKAPVPNPKTDVDMGKLLGYPYKFFQINVRRKSRNVNSLNKRSYSNKFFKRIPILN